MRDNGSFDIEHTLLAGVDGLRRGYSAVIKNCGKLVAGLAALTVILVTFTEIGFCDFGTRELTANVLLLLVASYVIYFSLEDAGEALGRESEEYLKVQKHLSTLCESIRAEMIGELRVFVEEYVKNELRQRREAMLSVNGKTIAEYEEYRKGKAVSGRDRRIFRRVKGLRAIKLGAGTLLSARRGFGAEMKNPRGPKLIGLCVRLIPTTVCTVFTASIMLGIKDGLGMTEVIEGIVRLCPLPIVALRGYSQGYTYVTEKEVEWMTAKARLLEAFLRTQCK